MLGWHISVFKLADGGAFAPGADAAEGPKLAVWRTGVSGLDWIIELVRQGEAVGLGGNGYPSRYSAPAKHLITRLVPQPPHARQTWLLDPGDVVGAAWAGKTVIDEEAIALCLPDEWLLIGHCCIEPSGEADTTDLPVGSSRHVPDGAIRAAQVVKKETRCGG